jgi:hypothetical protein
VTASLVLTSTRIYLDPSRWDDDLKLCHELYIRNCRTPVARLTDDEIKWWLNLEPASREQLSRQDRQEAEMCSVAGCKRLAHWSDEKCREHMRARRRELRGKRW